jgi:hypothetical protein
MLVLAGCPPHMGSNHHAPSGSEQTTIARLKALTPDKIQAETDRDYVLEGYFVNETVPMLVTDMELLRINRPLPESAYIVLQGPGIEAFAKTEASYGAFVRIRGRVRAERAANGRLMEIDFICPNLPEILRKAAALQKPVVIDICRINPRICSIIGRLPRKYALLYSGGYNAANAHKRYWNDLKFMYMTLRNKYGYTDANIVVVYKDGTGEDTDMPVDFAASTTGFDGAIAYLKSKTTANDDLFVFMTNHGGGFHEAHNANEGGRVDTSGDEVDPKKYDETTYYYNQTTNELWDDDLAAALNGLTVRRMVGVFEPCFSGGLLHDLRGSKRSLVSAASEFEYSWAMGPSNTYDTFSYHFTCALNKADPGGAGLSPNPDTNGDGKVSMLEAFLYAKLKDTDSETPFLEDSGDGIGTNTPSSTGTDGTFSSTVTP